MSMEKIFVTSDAGGLRLTVYPGDSKILIVMQLDDGVVYDHSKNLASFAIWRKVGDRARTAVS
jgi:hypothetical protein